MTRMWMVDPEILCNQHLLGEHKEVHQANGTLKKKMKITGFIRSNCIEPMAIQSRHDDLANELIKRKMNHKSPLEAVDICYLSDEEQKSRIDIDENMCELIRRCSKCRKKAEEKSYCKF